MLAELRMKLDTDKGEIGYYQSSNMQGILMSVIDSAYAKLLHEQALRPYSQYVYGGKDKEWVVKSLTKEAYENIILPLMDNNFAECYLEKKDMHIHITDKKVRLLEKKELLNEFYSDSYEKQFHIRYITPASFKSNNRYVIMPDLRLIYQSLMHKYSDSSKELDMYDEETLEQMVNYSYISAYRLKSTFFPVERVKIPSFMGTMAIRTVGTATLAKYIRLLLKFGEFSGVGIKTAMGMGSFELCKGEDE